MPKNYAKWIESGLARVICRPFICRFESRKRPAAVIGARRTGVGVRVIRRRLGLFRPANEGRGIEGRRQCRRAAVALALRPIRRRNGGERSCGDKHIQVRVWTGYAGRSGYIRLRAKNQNTLGVGLRGSALREFRFAVGSKDGPRSTIWKCWVQGDEAYIAGRLFGTETKISLHSTGECQWSCTDQWVRRDPDRRNADRHIAKWHLTYPQGHSAILAFRVAVPVIELRPEPVPPNQKKALWVGNAPVGSTVEFCFYFTRALDGPPSSVGNPALRHLASLQLRDGRWLVAFVWLRSLSATDIAAARDAAVAQAREAGVQVGAAHRLALFALPTAETSAAVLEVCATAA